MVSHYYQDSLIIHLANHGLDEFLHTLEFIIGEACTHRSVGMSDVIEAQHMPDHKFVMIAADFSEKIVSNGDVATVEICHIKASTGDGLAEVVEPLPGIVTQQQRISSLARNAINLRLLSHEVRED